jgi:hypothetical protein
MRENIPFLVFWAWLTSLRMVFSSSIHLLCFLLVAELLGFYEEVLAYASYFQRHTAS